MLPIGKRVLPRTLPPLASMTLVASACKASPKLKFTVTKNHVVPPRPVTSLPVPSAMAWVSSAQWLLTGEQVFEVNSVTAAAVIITVRLFSRATCCTAAATGVTGRSVMASTPESYHCRAMLPAMSGLFRVSA